MKAIIARDFAPLDQLVYGDWPEPQAIGRTVVIEAEAIGVNYPDGLLVQGLYQMRPPTPFVPGMEVAGRVVAVGPEVTAFKPGDRVAALSTHGSYAEKVGADEASVMKLPDALSVEDACALICGYGTSHYALKQRALLRPGETLAVLGASGATGIAAIQIGKLMGANVIGVASTDDKQAIARQAGADVVIGYDNLQRSAQGGDRRQRRRRRLRSGRRRCLRRAGAIDGVGRQAAGDRLCLRHHPEIPGQPGAGQRASAWSASSGAPSPRRSRRLYADNMRELIGWRLAGKVAPVIEGSYPLADAAAVLKRVLGRGSAGKLILRP